MNITLVHPIHGAKIATMELEAEADEQNGWTRYNPDTTSEPEEAAPVNVLEVKRRRKTTAEV
jgi:hypothetical protein